ncbi:MAG: helix-turn-helix domain-containing protein [Thermoplasmata archaeon]|nr:helix-turn-helix domain-containing protein [Candidatus Sysuiplasma jiujiangense]
MSIIADGVTVKYHTHMFSVVPDRTEGTLDYASMRFKIMHDGCTTALTNDLNDLVVSMQHCQPFKDRGYSWVVIDVKAYNKRDLSDYLYALKKHGKVRSILDVKREKRGNSLMLSLIEGYDGMISSLAYEMGAIQKMETAKNGEEFWNIVIPFVNKESFLELLPLYGKIIDLRIRESDFRSPENVVSKLTFQERSVLRTAFEMGFFDYPKRAHLKDIAEKTNLSIPTINEYIRLSQKKLLSYFVETMTAV